MSLLSHADCGEGGVWWCMIHTVVVIDGLFGEVSVCMYVLYVVCA